MRMLALLAITSVFASVAPGSGGLARIKPTTPKTELTGCEYNNAVLDTLAQKTKRDQVIIIVARLGTNESRKPLNQRRLHNVLVYLTEFTTPEGGRRKPADIVLAEGSTNTSYGVIEMYAEGKLFDTLRPGRNAVLHVGTCVPDDPGRDVCSLKTNGNFYPCLDKPKGTRH